jgi:hypothetical protein
VNAHGNELIGMMAAELVQRSGKFRRDAMNAEADERVGIKMHITEMTERGLQGQEKEPAPRRKKLGGRSRPRPQLLKENNATLARYFMKRANADAQQFPSLTVRFRTETARPVRAWASLN